MMIAGPGLTPCATATAVVAACGLSPAVVDVRPLDGGMISRVEGWQTDGSPAALVAKVSDDPADDAARREAFALRWMRAHSALPMPFPYGHTGAMAALT